MNVILIILGWLVCGAINIYLMARRDKYLDIGGIIVSVVFGPAAFILMNMWVVVWGKKE